ncbi:MFS transporter [Bacillus thuringiensis]|uniref:MFS transporter n=1 Tax=Bacillus thuringiensis TaxID=1428 RepID=UPI000BFD97E1|nr:MFS transporter [Bacillus thuringiensis]PGO54959.1 hypothetical protein CN986_15715 [Bacillus thuringiensis]
MKVLKDSIWSNRSFLLYAISRFISNFGTSLYIIALPLAVYKMTGSGTSMGLMGMFETLPLIFGPFIGTFTDYFSKKKVLIIAGVLQAICTGLIPLLFYLDILQVYHMYFFGFMLGILTTFMRNAEFSIISVLFKKDLSGANAGLSLMWTTAQFMGPIIAGLLMVYMDAFVLILVNALSFLFPALSMLKIDFTEKNDLKKEKSKGFLKKTIEGFVYIKHNSTLKWIIITLLISNLADNGLLLVLIYHFRAVLEMDNSTISWIMAFMGIGSILGSITYNKLKHISPNKLFISGFVISTVGTLGLLIPYWFVLPIVLLILSIGGILVGISQNVIIQESIPYELLGRVNGTIRMLALSMRPCSMFILPYLAQEFNTYISFGFVAALNLLSFLIILFSDLNEKKNSKKNIQINDIL